MSYAARFEFGLFNGPRDPRDAALSMRAVVHGCDFLLRCNVDYLLAYGREVPRFYNCGLRYQTLREACGGDVWQDIPTLIQRKVGDCKDLACFRAADLIVRERINAKPIVRRRWLDRGFGLYHVVVLLPDGTVEDPSLLLGMTPGTAA